MLKIGHTVTVPPSLRGPNPDDEPETIGIPEELETVPGSPIEEETVTFYAKHYPIETESVEHFAYIKFILEVSDIKDAFQAHIKREAPVMKAAGMSGDMEPTGEPVARDVTAEIKAKAMEFGYSMVGITAYDARYTFASKRNVAKPFPHAICLALKQPYEPTQMAPSLATEDAVLDTYRDEGILGLKLGEYIRSLGYHAQVQPPQNANAAFIPMFVQAGMGQMGAMGYMLSPHFGSRQRLMLVTTDAPVTHDEPVDYGVNAFCSVCQVCVNRCPGRALMREKVWWRGVQKFKLIAKRCRPVIARYSACGVCIKVCPIQRYGLKPVMDHYSVTGQVLGKGTYNLEGYELPYDGGFFAPGELPKFPQGFFDVPEGYADQYLFEELKKKIQKGEVPEGEEGEKFWDEFRTSLQEAIKGPADVIAAGYNRASTMDPL